MALIEKVQLIVFKAKDGEIYATMHDSASPSFPNLGEEIIFTKEISVDEENVIEKLQKEAKKEARQRGINHVINLDS